MSLPFLHITNLYIVKRLGITNDFLNPSNSKIYEKEPWYNKTSLQRTHFASPLALRYIEVPYIREINRAIQGIEIYQVASVIH